MPRERARDRGEKTQRRDVPDARGTAARIEEELRLLQEGAGDNSDRLALLHEITVYQEELIVQNEALVSAQAALEETRDRFVELYEFAPNAYVTLDPDGIVRQCNLAACALFG